jgi:tetratricopeptide (TPR) repeat protein
MVARVLGCLALMLLGAVTVGGQESVQAAEALYASAAYDEALVVLQRLEQAAPTPGELRVINQQRALCLLALGRTADAEQAIAAVVNADPLFRPDATTTSPRIRAAFRDVRTKLLPELVAREYVEARRLYDDKAWPEAAAAFERVLSLATDADLTEDQKAALEDKRLLADGFAKLAHAAATPPPPPAPEPEPEAPAPPPAPVVDYTAVFDGSSAGVVAPVTLRQDIPRWNHPSLPMPKAAGTLEVIVSPEGVIERATLTHPITAFYDRQLLEATRNWRYRPATLDGHTVRFRKLIRISFQ